MCRERAHTTRGLAHRVRYTRSQSRSNARCESLLAGRARERAVEREREGELICCTRAPSSSRYLSRSLFLSPLDSHTRLPPLLRSTCLSLSLLFFLSLVRIPECPNPETRIRDRIKRSPPRKCRPFDTVTISLSLSLFLSSLSSPLFLSVPLAKCFDPTVSYLPLSLSLSLFAQHECRIHWYILYRRVRPPSPPVAPSLSSTTHTTSCVIPRI